MLRHFAKGFLGFWSAVQSLLLLIVLPALGVQQFVQTILHAIYVYQVVGNMETPRCPIFSDLNS